MVKGDKLIRKSGIGLVEILVALVIVAAVFYIFANVYFKKRLADTNTQKVLSESGIDASRYDTILNTTKAKLKDIDKRQRENNAL